MNTVQHFRDLEVYQGAMEIVMSVSDLTKKFPADEKYVLSDQIRRCSRSVCANLAEAWRKRRYLAAFISKLSDAETEAAENTGTLGDCISSPIYLGGDVRATR
jgi:four helix bundle protein